MVITKLSATMQEALGLAREHGGLERWPGGFWTYIGCPTLPRHFGTEAAIPEWSCGTQTVDGLVNRGLLVYSDWYTGTGRFPGRRLRKATPADARD